MEDFIMYDYSGLYKLLKEKNLYKSDLTQMLILKSNKIMDKIFSFIIRVIKYILFCLKTIDEYYLFDKSFSKDIY